MEELKSFFLLKYVAFVAETKHYSELFQLK